MRKGSIEMIHTQGIMNVGGEDNSEKWMRKDEW